VLKFVAWLLPALAVVEAVVAAVRG